MHPTLFELPWGGTANAYGTLILLGTLASMPGVWWDAGRRGVAADRRASFFVDFYLALALGAFVGGRLLHVLTMPREYVDDPMRVFVSDGTGFVFFGSLLAIVASWAWLARRHGVSFATLCDLAATWMALGHGFGRLGCFFAGCCWGAPGPTPPAMSFGPESIVALSEGAPLVDGATVPLHPVQLYESIGLFVLAAVLIAIRCLRGVEPRWRQASRYALGYGLLRLLTEMFRGDASRGLAWTWSSPTLAELLGLPPAQPLLLSSSQAMALVLVLVGVLGLRRTRPRA
ncbi:MAG: prolipoprotein diacylglyceryl transferase [Deltaproteobacteria bacterium]|nr:prolipoprotein diacylglyceryl transferase [Deltaproteobacteria bacterium]MBK8238115.1 prolipoprotein diacylglyceryl transferase [Deltaproteobacteria bacterium]MBP7288603.1 prolipoprotein diacylglyceryl transferase [Nannocystaceae bacterium]